MKPQKQLVTYIKLPEYMIPFVFRRFGNPVTFNAGDWFSKLLSRSLVCVEDMSCYNSRISCSQHAMELAKLKTKGVISEDDYPGTPDGDLDMFVPIVIPSTVMVADDRLGITRTVPTSNLYAFTLKGAQAMRKLIRQLFWSDLSQFHKDYSSGGTHKHDLFRFLRLHNISEDMFDNVVRAETRLEKEMV